MPVNSPTWPSPAWHCALTMCQSRAFLAEDGHIVAYPLHLTHCQTLTRKRASQALKAVKAARSPTICCLLMRLRLLHTAAHCFRLLDQCTGSCCKVPNAPAFIDTNPCNSGCNHTRKLVCVISLCRPTMQTSTCGCFWLHTGKES